jgi:hypothetical protein
VLQIRRDVLKENDKHIFLYRNVRLEPEYVVEYKFVHTPMFVCLCSDTLHLKCPNGYQKN